jgi:excisionase family DNA binding protein
METPDRAIPWVDRVTVRPREVAERTGISLTAIYDAINDGSLKATKVSAKVWVVRPADVDDWLDLQRDDA